MDNINAREFVAKNLHFVGKKGYTLDQDPQGEKLIQDIDVAIDKGIADIERETGVKITLNDGERYELRWQIIRDLLIERGCDPAELDAMAEAAREATEEAIADHEKRVDSFKIVK